MSALHIIIRSTNQNVVSISQVGKTPIRHFERHMVKHGLDWTSKTWTGLKSPDE